MNIKNLSIALIIALTYEIVLKLSYTFIPSLANAQIVSNITAITFIIVKLIIVLFLFYFYLEEKSNKILGLTIKIIFALFTVNFLFRAQIAQKAFGVEYVRLINEIFGFITVILLFLLLILFKRGILPDEKKLNLAVTFVLVMFGFNIIKSLYSVFMYFRFVISGITASFPGLFINMMFLLFLITHLSIIYFLFRYYQIKTR